MRASASGVLLLLLLGLGLLANVSEGYPSNFKGPDSVSFLSSDAYNDNDYYYDDDSDEDDDRLFVSSEETEEGKLQVSIDDRNSVNQEDDRSSKKDSKVDGLYFLPDTKGLEYSLGKHKRSVKGSYQSSQQVVQVPQQAVQVSAPYGSEQGTIDSGLLDSIQEGSSGSSGVSEGVEPVQPVGGPQQHEVGAGVEPERGSPGSTIGGWFREGWNTFTDAFENLGDKVEDSVDRLHDTVSGAVDTVHQAYDELLERLPQILDRFKSLILKFSLVIQDGARYFLGRFEHAFDQVKESLVFEKLEKKLEEGHAEVVTFFQILGEKVQGWRAQHVDAGLLDGYTSGSGQVQQEGGVQRQDIENMPDFFQDGQVIVQLNKLRDVGVLTEDDIIILTQEHVTQNQQTQYEDQQQSQQNQQTQYEDQQQSQQNQQTQYEDQQQSQQNQQTQYEDQQQSQQNQQQQTQNSGIQQQSQQQNYYSQQQQQNQNPAEFIQFPE